MPNNSEIQKEKCRLTLYHKAHCHENVGMENKNEKITRHLTSDFRKTAGILKDPLAIYPTGKIQKKHRATRVYISLASMLASINIGKPVMSPVCYLYSGESSQYFPTHYISLSAETRRARTRGAKQYNKKENIDSRERAAKTRPSSIIIII